MSLLRVQNLTKRFSGVVALKDVRFELLQGEVHAICGENGAGKSTLIKVLSGVHPAGGYEGSIQLEGRPVAFRGVADSEAAGITVIHQELALVRELTVAENIFLGAEPSRMGWIDFNRLYADARRLIERHGLDLDPAARIKDLGIGQQQLVEILKAVSKRSRILMLDEPTAALTRAEVEILFTIIRDLRRRGIACIYISHKLEEIFEIADRVTILRDGETVVTLQTDQTSKGKVIRYMVGRELDELFPRRPTPAGGELLKVEGLGVDGPNGGRPALREIDFELRRGEILGLGGLMGAGRTELLMHLMGVFGDRTAGRVFLDGQPFHPRSPLDAIAQGVILVSEDRRRYGLIPGQGIGFNLSLSSLDRFTDRGVIDRSGETRRNQQLIGSLRIQPSAQEALLGGLSGGNQQKVVLGRALMTEPRVMLLDEPTRGIDIGAKQEVYQLLNELKSQGMAIVLASSEWPELMGLADRIIILSEGRVGGVFTHEEATQETLLGAAMAHH
jgi:D-xylose transport system ATP-binding protein